MILKTLQLSHLTYVVTYDVSEGKTLSADEDQILATTTPMNQAQNAELII